MCRGNLKIFKIPSFWIDGSPTYYHPVQLSYSVLPLSDAPGFNDFENTCLRSVIGRRAFRNAGWKELLPSSGMWLRATHCSRL